MHIALRILLVLIGLLALAGGIQGILRREARWPSGEQTDDRAALHGWPAVLWGIVQVVIGVCLVFFQRLPWAL